MRIAIDEIVEIKEYYEAHYEAIYKHLVENQMIRHSDIRDFEEDVFETPTKHKLFETGSKDMDQYIEYIYGIIQRLETHIETFQSEVDGASHVALDSGFFEAVQHLSKDTLQAYDDIYEMCKTLEEEYKELHDACEVEPFSEFNEIRTILLECVDICDETLERMSAFDRSYDDFFTKISDPQFKSRLEKKVHDMLTTIS